MGFSTSGSVAVLLIGLLVAASVAVPTVFSLGSDTGNAFAAQSEQLRDQKNTDITVVSATNTTDNVTVTVANNGTITLDLDNTDVLINGRYIKPNTTTIIYGSTDERTETKLWPPGTTLEIVIDQATLDTKLDGDPERVMIVTETAIADSEAIVDE